MSKGGALHLQIGPRADDYVLAHWSGDLFSFFPTGENALGITAATFHPGTSKSQATERDAGVLQHDGAGHLHPAVASPRRRYSGQRDRNLAGRAVRAAARRHLGARVQERGDQAHGRGDAGRRPEHDQERARRSATSTSPRRCWRRSASASSGAATRSRWYAGGAVQPRVPEAFTGLNRIPILMLGPLLHASRRGVRPAGRRRPDRAAAGGLPRGRAAGHGRGGGGGPGRDHGPGRPAVRGADRPALPERGRHRDGAADRGAGRGQDGAARTRPPSPRWWSSRCSCSGWARTSSSARTGGSSSRACRGCAAPRAGWPGTGSRRSPTWSPG